MNIASRVKNYAAPRRTRFQQPITKQEKAAEHKKIGKDIKTATYNRLFEDMKKRRLIK